MRQMQTNRFTDGKVISKQQLLTDEALKRSDMLQKLGKRNPNFLGLLVEAEARIDQALQKARDGGFRKAYAKTTNLSCGCGSIRLVFIMNGENGQVLAIGKKKDSENIMAIPTEYLKPVFNYYNQNLANQF